MRWEELEPGDVLIDMIGERVGPMRVVLEVSEHPVELHLTLRLLNLCSGNVTAHMRGKAGRVHRQYRVLRGLDVAQNEGEP